MSGSEHRERKCRSMMHGYSSSRSAARNYLVRTLDVNRMRLMGSVGEHLLHNSSTTF